MYSVTPLCINFRLIICFFKNNTVIIHNTVKDLSPFMFCLFIRYLPDDGWSGQPKRVAMYKKYCFLIPVFNVQVTVHRDKFF